MFFDTKGVKYKYELKIKNKRKRKKVCRNHVIENGTLETVTKKNSAVTV